MTSVGFLNVCSLRRKVAEIEDFISTRGVHILGVAETWLSADVTDREVNIPHFSVFRKDREGRQGGGVAFYCHTSLQVRRRRDLECELEMLWLEILAPGRPGNETVLLGCCYRPPSESAGYWDGLESNLETACSGPQTTTVLVGDFNVNFNDAHAVTPLHHVLNQFNLRNHVTSPTRVTSSTATLLDLFLSTTPIQGVCETIHLDISDHSAILARLPISASHHLKGQHLRKTRCLHKVDWNMFTCDLEKTLTTCDSVCVDVLASSLTAGIQTTLDKHAPLRERRRKSRRPCPWITDELVASVRERNRAHRLWLRDKTDQNLQEAHRSARSKARKLDRSLRNLYFTKRCDTSDQRQLWAVMNDVTGRQKTRKEPEAPLESLSKLFGDIVHDPMRPPELHIPHGPASASSFSTFQPVSVSDVAQCLQTVSPHKASGSDNIPGIVLQQCSHVLAPPFTTLVNASLTSGTVPVCFKTSHISPLFKSGDATSPTNYRPVSLLPILSRILEFFVKKQLTAYLTQHSILPSSQFAYRKMHSTEDALVLAANRWLLAKQERKYTGIRHP